MPTMRPQPWHAYQLGWEAEGIGLGAKRGIDHGVVTGYQRGCRCPECREAATKARARARSRAKARA